MNANFISFQSFKVRPCIESKTILRMVFSSIFLLLFYILLFVFQVTSSSAIQKFKRSTKFECGVAHNSVALVHNGMEPDRYEFPW